MKSLLVAFSLFIIIANTSCTKTSTAMLNEVVDTSAVLKFQGNFAGIGGEQVSGQAKIYVQKGKHFLALENFSTTNGPDLKVYLSQNSTPQNFVKLGDLKSTNGNQVYDISMETDITKYKYALIHCERFNHLFGVAEFK